jgi:DNA-binding IclR family transcriptional regulator
MGDRLPASVTQFLETHIDSVEQLQVLLLLSLEPERAWTVAGIAERLSTSTSSVEIRLSRLISHGLIEQAGDTYSYTLTGAGDRRVREVAAYFKSRRAAVIGAIFASERGHR